MVRCAAGLAAAFALAAAHPARAECNRLTRPLANRISAAARRRAPAWARPLIAPAHLMRFDANGLHELTYFPGWSAITLERLGTRGAAPFQVTVVVRCREGRAQAIDDAYAWANATARALHITLANAQQAADFTAEVVALSAGARPEAANATRRNGAFRVEVSLAPRAGESSPRVLHFEVTRDAVIQPVQP